MGGLLFRGGRIFDGEAFVEPTDLRVAPDGRVQELGTDLAPGEDEETIDLAGRWLLPGLVDCHVHFREPGLVRKEGYATGSRGALHGGVTTVLEIQNNPPLMDRRSVLDAKLDDLQGVSHVDYGCYASLVLEAVPELAALALRAPAAKCFLGCSTGAGGVSDEAELERLFRAAAEADLCVVAHCEDNEVMEQAAGRWESEPEPRHDWMRPAEAEVRSIRSAIGAAERTGTRLHVFHLSTAEGARLVREAAERGLPVTGSTAPHYLLLTAEDATVAGQNRLKVNPAIKSGADRAGLIAAVEAGHLDCVGTDHAPHPLEEKDRPYRKAPSGFPSIDLLLPLMIAVHDRSGLSLERALHTVTAGPADEFGLRRKGRLRPGADADLVVCDPAEVRPVEETQLPSKSKWSPYQGWRLRGFPSRVFLRGREVFREGEFPEPPGGRPLF